MIPAVPLLPSPDRYGGPALVRLLGTGETYRYAAGGWHLEDDAGSGAPLSVGSDPVRVAAGLEPVLLRCELIPRLRDPAPTRLGAVVAELPGCDAAELGPIGLVRTCGGRVEHLRSCYPAHRVGPGDSRAVLLPSVFAHLDREPRPTEATYALVGIRSDLLEARLAALLLDR